MVSPSLGSDFNVAALATVANGRVGNAGRRCHCRAGVKVLAMPELLNVSLRARTDDDLDVLFAVAADLDTWEERNPEGPRPVTRARFDARTARSDEDPGDNVSFVVDLDGTAVGSASLFDFDSLARNAEAGIALVAGARGRGIGTLAIAQLVEFGFVRRNLHRIHLQAIASNTAAIRAYEKAGFVIEGRQREQAWVRGTYEDIVRMGMLRSEHA
jgi:RimJ/RimL family protein N-acetyltransferase